MKITWLAVVTLALICPPLWGQTYVITETGTLSNEAGLDGTVMAGTPFTVSETFTVSDATESTDPALTGNGFATFVDPTGSASVSFGDYNFNWSAPEITVYSQYPDTVGDLVYGYQLGSTGSSDQFSAQLLSTLSSTAPTTSLDSVHDVAFADFNVSNKPFLYEKNSLAVFASSSIDGFSVQVQATPVPEPSTLWLLAPGLAALWLRSRRYKTVE